MQRYIAHKYTGPSHRSRKHFIAALTRYAIVGVTLLLLIWVASWVVPSSWLPSLSGSTREEVVDGVDVEKCSSQHCAILLWY